MNDKKASSPSAAPSARGPQSRDDRLKAALKANMARRKAQIRARSDAGRNDEAPQAEQDKD